jgi:hypothetical protein
LVGGIGVKVEVGFAVADGTTDSIVGVATEQLVNRTKISNTRFFN